MVCTLDGRQVPTQWAWKARSRFFQAPSLCLEPVAEWLWPWVWGGGGAGWRLEGCHSSICHSVSAESLAIHTSLLFVSQHPPLWPQFPHFVGLPVFPVYRYHYQEQHFPGELRSKKTFLKTQRGIKVFYSDIIVLDRSGVLAYPGTGDLGNTEVDQRGLGGSEPDSPKSARQGGVWAKMPQRGPPGGCSPSHTKQGAPGSHMGRERSKKSCRG